MLTHGRAIRWIGLTDCERDLFCDFINIRQYLVRNVVDIFGMLLGNYEDISWIIDPPFWRNIGQSRRIFVDNVGAGINLSVLALGEFAHGAAVGGGLVVEHGAKNNGRSGNKTVL